MKPKAIERQQDALIKQLHDGGVNVICTGLVSEKSIAFVMRAFSQGISTVAIVYPIDGSFSNHFRPANGLIVSFLFREPLVLTAVRILMKFATSEGCHRAGLMSGFPPKVEYELTELGKTLYLAMKSLVD